ncbi:MAG TPA: 23S rRNA (uracil(1939)-C(5))-methyltransferase RlmD [Bacteriovoracaceae bacterium]|nr:23S rRNA (uracil(1939)-C(5))-methyltransferase RlmD [Bacteriovoracaceae bacterium]
MNTFCAYFEENVCRSCQLLAYNYQDQILHKESILRERLSLSKELLLPTTTSSYQGFRNKVKLAVGIQNNEITLGLVDKNFNSTDLSRCPVQHPVINEMLPLIKEFLQTAKLTVFNPTKNKGELKNIIIYYNPHSEQSYLRLVLRSKEAQSRIQKYLPLLQEKMTHLKVVSINIQPSPHPILEGEEEIILTKQTHLQHTIGDIQFKLSSQGFVQTNLEVSTKLYQTAAHWIKELNAHRFLELFSGQGAFSFFAAQNVSEALGIEINPSAVESANLSAQEMGLTHLQFKCLDAKDVADHLQEYQPDILLANPPRRGLGESTELINQFGPTYFIYSSCNVETLAIDIQNLTNYQIKKAQIFDMFAHTAHFETLVLLERIN